MASDNPRETLPQRYPSSASSGTTPTPTLFHSFPIPPTYNHNYNNHNTNANSLSNDNSYMRDAASVSTSSLLLSGRPLPTPPSVASPYAMSPPPPIAQAPRVPGASGGKVVHVGKVTAWKPKLDLESMDTSPFSESFSAMFDDSDVLEVDTSSWVPEKSFNIERYTDPKDLDPSWKEDYDISEILVISPKPTIRKRASNLSTANPKLPIIPEYALGVNHAKYQSFDESIKLADFEFLPTPSPTRRANNALPPSPSRTSSRARLTSHICAYRRACGVLQYNGLYTVKRRAHAHAQVNSTSAWREMDVMHVLSASGAGSGTGMGGDVPFVEKMYGTFIDNKNIYLVLGHHTRGTLADLVETYGPLNEMTTKAYACELLCALEAIAKAGVVHNDICPDNVRIDASRHLVLVNFEVADLPGESSVQPNFDSDYSRTAGRNRERAYKAPEVLLGWTRNSAVDVWGFGMVLYWMVTGRHPFLGGDECESLREAELEGKILHGPLLLDDMEESCHEAKGLIAKCLERNPAIRIRTGQLKGEAYFSHADWERIATRKVPILGFNHKRKQTGGVTSRKSSVDGDVKVAVSDALPLEQSPLISEGNRKRPTPDMFTNSCNPPSSASAACPKMQAGEDVHQSRVEYPLVKEDAPAARPPGALDPMVTAEEYIEEVEISREHPPEMHGRELTSQERMALFWESLDSEEVMTQMHQSTTALGIIGIRDGANISPRPRKLRKKSKSMRTLTHRISTFSLTGQTPNKLRKKSVRKMASEAHLLPHEPEVRFIGGAEGEGHEGIVVEPTKIPNLPQGVEQIGHGIGFTYGMSAAAKSKASICTDKSAPGWKRHMRLLPGGIGRGIRGVRHRLSMGKMNGNSGQQSKVQDQRDDYRPRDGMEYARGVTVDYNRGLGIGMEYGNSNAAGGCCYASPATDDQPLTPDSLAFGEGRGTAAATEVKIEGEFGAEGVGPRMATLRLVPSTPQEDCDYHLDRIRDLY
ncbi:hypothetical protein BDN71DRAFT_1452165 [Pleurotus eryngii]|uniref:non-specific serine/threonine protein kinase n=1 Tax=Pleurotus eryngii TaxID=5323 RepID=A0A9P6D5K0_PLEER|nr:hypothetical protein BDN71DRAFT_1452165 [Pleurotus eryngii]